MSVRGRRSHSHMRRLMAPPASARSAADVEIAESPQVDAELLMATFRVRAYSEARQRQRGAATAEAASHWARVANLITRRTQGFSEPSTGTELDPRAARSRERGVRPFVGFFEVDTLDELERVLAARPQHFRLQFFGAGANLGPAVLSESEFEAADASEAIRDAVAATWPPRAVGLRLLDLEGREIFERLKADLR